MTLRWMAVLALASGCAPIALAGNPEKFAVSFEGGYQALSSAPDSAKAVFAGSTGDTVWGGALRVRVSRSLFVGAGMRFFKKDGQRVFLDAPGGTVYPLGHPLSVRLRPIYGFVGWRLRPEAALVPYLAAGGGITSYREESTVGGVAESTSVNKATWHAALGADYRLGSFGLGCEARWSWIPNVIGLGGVSRIYGETDLGGFSVVGRLSFGR